MAHDRVRMLQPGCYRGLYIDIGRSISQKVFGLGAPKSVNEEGTRSISRKQQIGVK